MVTKYTNHFQTKQTPQSEAIPGKTQVKNDAGGYVFAVNDWVRLERFLILGCEGNTYYSTEKKLTIENATAVVNCIKEDGKRVVDILVDISDKGKAVKNNTALFVLSMCASLGNAETKSYALANLQKVARITTHLITFVEYCEQFRGWGRGLRNAVSNWYLSKSPDQLAYQICKYQQRAGWSHRDLLRLSHPKTISIPHNAMFKYLTKDVIEGEVPALISDFTELQKAESKKEVINLIKKNSSISFEMIPTQFLAEKDVWKELLPNIPMTALIRNLARMTANELLKPLSKEINLVAEKLTNQNFLRKARIHPISVLGALLTYKLGHGIKGSLRWNPERKILDALDSAFYLTFQNVEATNKRILFGVDVSGSMESGTVGGMPGLTPRIGAAAMSLVIAATETNSHIMGFSNTFVNLNISPKQRLDDVINVMNRIPFGGTDCSLPMLWALQNKVEVDAFIVITDSETWSGGIHPTQALQEYRRKMNIPAKLIVIGMISNGFSIADPNDSGMLDVVGFSTDIPNLINNFIK